MIPTPITPFPAAADHHIRKALNRSPEYGIMTKREGDRLWRQCEQQWNEGDGHGAMKRVAQAYMNRIVEEVVRAGIRTYLEQLTQAK